ncbi:hypothetical protein TNCV_2063911 [Trichonephila clavipes]|nr:hypothetical protein TNCV_2063911 [Trichonephila clavipes]
MKPPEHLTIKFILKFIKSILSVCVSLHTYNPELKAEMLETKFTSGISCLLSAGHYTMEEAFLLKDGGVRKSSVLILHLGRINAPIRESHRSFPYPLHPSVAIRKRKALRGFCFSPFLREFLEHTRGEGGGDATILDESFN